ncbi:MAG TPA: DHHA2 domain-containing protein [Anaerolineales bacterium]|nr:DHHA2 domain-containing protein [Anaerolineales bacterium]
MDPITDRVYVIGHANPDTDSIASAVGYSWLLRETQAMNAVGARAGHLNPQTLWVIRRLEIDPPLLLPDASPRFESITHRLNTSAPSSPLREAWTIANRTGGVAPIVNDDGTPYGLLTAPSLFDFLGRSIGVGAQAERMHVGEILDRPCSEACDTDVPRFQSGARIRDALPRILREERSEFWVVDESNRYLGVFRQREALNPPRLRLILVDHNEAGQALGALEEAEIIEILDHHRLGNSSTIKPIRMTVDVVGSTSTLVTERIEDAGLSAPPPIAGVLLGGLVSDTLVLTSPTTTPRDHRAAALLARWAFVGGSPLEGETVKTFGDQVLGAGTGLASRDPQEIIHADLKTYESGGLEFAISQVEVTNLAQLPEHQDALLGALINLRDRDGLDFAMLMVTDVVRRDSRLLLTNEVPALDGLPFPRLPDGGLRADGVVSRKMQLLPVVLSALEG